MSKRLWHSLSVLKDFDVCFKDGHKVSISGWIIPIFGVPVYIEGKGLKYHLRAKRLISRATRHAEKLRDALIALEQCETEAAAYLRQK